jgi:hypothetical protein
MTKSTGKNRSLGTIGQTVLDLALAEHPTLFNTEEMCTRFKIDEHQAHQVKRFAKRRAASDGLMFSWDPSIGKFRVCPQNSASIAKVMVEYAYKSWAASGNEMNTLVTGALGQGFVTKAVHADTTAKNDLVTEMIRATETGIKFKRAAKA